jgi:hypothetical protein
MCLSLCFSLHLFIGFSFLIKNIVRKQTEAVTRVKSQNKTLKQIALIFRSLLWVMLILCFSLLRMLNLSDLVCVFVE